MKSNNIKKTEILNVAEKLFSINGFDGTSVRDIATEAGVNVAMISYYFGSKDKLLEALLLYRIEGLRLKIEEVSKESITPIQKMEKVIELYITRIQANRSIYNIIHSEIIIKKRVMECREYNEIKEHNIEFLRSIVKEGQDHQVFVKNVLVELIPPLIIGSYIHFETNSNFYKEYLQLKTEEAYINYIKTTFLSHIKRTILALLTNEKE